MCSDILHCGWDYKMCMCGRFGKQTGRSSNSWTELPCDLAVLLDKGKHEVYTKTCRGMFTAIIFIIFKKAETVQMSIKWLMDTYNVVYP